MNTTELICPQCGQAYPMDEEFCPVHGVPLVARTPVDVPDEPGHEVPTPPVADTTPAGDTSTPAAPLLQPGPASEPPDSPDAPGASEPPASPSDPVDHSLIGKLGRVLRFKGLRPLRPRPADDGAEAEADQSGDGPPADNPNVDNGPSHRPGHPAQGRSKPGTDASPLPREVADMGWQVNGLPLSVGGADHWPVLREAQPEPVKGVFCLLHSGSLTTPAVYRQLLSRPTTSHHRARLWQHGTSDRGHGIRADYELVTVAGDGVELSSWLRDTSPGEARALSLLPALHGLLQALHDEGLAPLVLEPGLLVRHSTGALALSRLWALAEAPADEAPAVLRYRPEFQRTVLLPVPWAAPELSASQVESANAAVFSVGQLLACALWGQPATHQELRSGALPFRAIQHPGLARLMQLCLWHLPEGRASLAQLRAALAAPEAVDAMPTAPAWASLMPGAASQAFTLAGASHWRLEDLLEAAVEPDHWDEAVHQVEAILTWAQGTAWASTAGLLQDALRHGGRSPDWVLLNLSRRVRPQAPITWRRLDLTDAQAEASLVALAQGALGGNADDLALMQRLFQADLRGALLTDTLHTGPH